MEEKKLYGALTVYRERGAYLRRLEQFEKSLATYNEAYKEHPNDVRLLNGRSQVCADAVRPRQAYADAELALQLEPHNLTARHMQACALFTMCDFEHSVVKNYRGAQVRQQPPYFKDGIIQGLETIQECIGKQAGQVMLKFLPIIKHQETLYGEDHAPEKTKRVSRIPRPEVKKKLTQIEARKREMLSRVLAMKYLGEMAYDKFFLQDLLKDPRMVSANKAGSAEIKELAEKALRALNERQEMLRAGRPYYSIKQTEKSESKYLTKYREKMLEQERVASARYAEYLLRQIDKCLRERRIIELMAKAERMQSFLSKKSLRTLPDKEAYIDRLYRFVGDGYLNLHRISFSLSEKSNRSRIAFLLGIPCARPSSYDSVRAKYPYKFGDHKKYFERMKHELDSCENSTMKCWILYELAQLCIEQKNYALAKFYAKGCQREAENVWCVPWWLNACFILMSGDLKQGNNHEVINMIEEAFEWTTHLPHPEQTRYFLRKCMDLASDVVLPDERKAISTREKAILQIMDEKSRKETKVLFKRMMTVPVGRRFCVLPSLQAAPAQRATERRRYHQRGLTVVPGKTNDLPRPPKSKVAGFQTFDI